MPPVGYKTCDTCRKRKTKCMPPPEDNDKHEKEAPCLNCSRLDIDCTYDHIYKRPGRPTSYARDLNSGDRSSERSASPKTSAQISQAEARKDGPGPRDRPTAHTRDHNQSGTFVTADHQRARGLAVPGSASQHRELGAGHLQPSSYNSSYLAPAPYRASPTKPASPFSSFFGNHFAPPGQTAVAHASSTKNATVDPLFLMESHSPLRGPDGEFNLSEWSEHDLVTDWPTASTGASGGHTFPSFRSPSATLPPFFPGTTSNGPVHVASTGRPDAPAILPQHPSDAPGSSAVSIPELMTTRPSLPSLPSLPSGSSPRRSHSSHRPVPIASSPDIQIEDVAPWNTISFFITLYLRYSHSLFPMVHRPSFSQDLAMRRDKGDRDFRALVLGIVAYTIGQSPLSRMTSEYDRADLSHLQHRCHRASMVLLDRGYRNPNVMQVGTLVAGYFYCQSVGKTNRALTLIAEACQLMHLLRMHDDEATAGMGLDAVDVQIRRRIWWHTHAVDITEASAGNPIHLNAFEGRPSLPLMVDDEFLTSQGSFPQPITHTSYMVGFVACIRQFPLLEEPVARLRRLQYLRRTGTDLGAAERKAELRWIASAHLELEAIMDALPDILKLGWTFSEMMDEVRVAVMGMQRANLAITAVSIRFALADYKAELADPAAASLDAERATMGQDAYQTLACIPLDDLAANGESMRGKIFRILLALLKCNTTSHTWFNTLQDWWSLFSRVQFVQLMASNVDSRLPSRQNSPEPPVPEAIAGSGIVV